MDEAFIRIGKLEFRGQTVNSIDNFLPRKAACDSEDHVCCRSIFTEEPNAKSCTKNGFSCQQLFNCDIDKKILSAASSDKEKVVTTPRRDDVTLAINNEISLCPRDNQVCCQDDGEFGPERTGPTKLPRPPYNPKCGQHHKLGLFSTNQSPTDGVNATQFGEWPFACLLYKKEDSKEIYIGGATLLTPGVLVTAAHKIE